MIQMLESAGDLFKLHKHLPIAILSEIYWDSLIFLIEIIAIYNVLLVSGVQKSDSDIYSLFTYSSIIEL